MAPEELFNTLVQYVRSLNSEFLPSTLTPFASNLTYFFNSVDPSPYRYSDYGTGSTKILNTDPI